MKNYSLAFSPCPNDTFIFDAMIHGRLADYKDTWDVHLMDVEALNRNAANHMFDVTKLSFAAYAFVSNHYRILAAGSALGRGCGPLIISKVPMNIDDLKDAVIAIPGKHTTAHLLMSMFVKECKGKVEMLFSDIEEAVLSGKVDAGLIIHENRFTYAAKALWEEKTGNPIPLGCIAIKRSLPQEEMKVIENQIKNSVQFAFSYPELSKPYIKAHAQEMSEEVQQQHINLYVNDFSIDLGTEGRNAISELFNEGQKAGILPELVHPVFV
jgi:1,4-dihydroxy-6-naphthoate synthase